MLQQLADLARPLRWQPRETEWACHSTLNTVGHRCSESPLWSHVFSDV
ncbi:MAG: hypothetical protein JWP80_2162 [Pseudomonas sp.]|nr:hypothetical protein [Pseudomonas sp.]